MEAWGDTPGERYVKNYLDPEQYRRLDIPWVAEAINNGWFIVCQCCHFIRLPRAPFPYDTESMRKYGDPGPEGCDVCFSVHEAATLPVSTQHTFEAIETAAQDLREARTERVHIFYELWMSSVRGADAVIWDAMRRGIQRAVKQAQRSQSLVVPNLASMAAVK